MRSEELKITQGDEQKFLSMYPPTKPIKGNLEWMDNKDEENKDIKGYFFFSSH